MSKFKIKASLYGKERTIEVDRTNAIRLNEIKILLAKQFGYQSVSLRYQKLDGAVMPISTEQHLSIAIKDCIKGRASNLKLTLLPESAPVSPSALVSTPAITTVHTSTIPATSKSSRPLTPTRAAAPFTPSLVPAPRLKPEELYCGGCNKSVAGTCGVMAAGVPWHKDCFICSSCSLSLLTGGYGHSNGKLYCVSHYQEICTVKCCICQQQLTAEYVGINGKEYHRDCCVCNRCGRALVDGYLLQNDQLLCGSCV